MTGASPPAPRVSMNDESFDAVVVGAGLGGLYALFRLRALGMRVVAIEAGDDVGGTWYSNRYPGARCDVESVDYSYSFSDELQQSWVWKERFAAQPDILAYIRHVVERFELRCDIRFGVGVLSAQYMDQDETAEDEPARWQVGLDTGETLTTRYLVMATGSLSTTNVPDLPGLADFAGDWFHSARWPEEPPDFSGRTVGLIGTGSTGIQLVPELARMAERLVVFQRTPNYIMPAQNRPLSAEELAQVRSWYPERRRMARTTARGFPLPPATTAESALAFGPEERQSRYETMWRHGGAVFTATFGDLTVNRGSNDTAAEFVRAKIRSLVKDPNRAALLSPTDHPFASKRPCVDSGYYETFNRSNVELVDVRADPVERVVPQGIQTSSGVRELDVLVFATGFDAITGTLFKIDIRGRDGRTLREHWAHGPRSYLGIGVAGFPNLFLLTGPGSPSVLCNMVVSIEQHVDWICDLLRHLVARGVDTVEPTDEAELAWVEHVSAIAGATLLVEGNSWYLGANIPGKPRAFMPYAGGMASYDAEVQEIARDGYRGFVLTADSRASAKAGQGSSGPGR